MPKRFNKLEAHKGLVTRILDGKGETPQPLRRAAFQNSGLGVPLRDLVRKIAMEPTQISDEGIAAAWASGRTEDQIFELAICAAIGQSTRELQTALAALDRAVTSGDDSHAT